MSHGWSGLPILAAQTPSFNIKIYPTTTTRASRKTLSPRLLRRPPLPLPSLPLPLFFISPYPSTASHLSLSLPLSPHPFPPPLRVSGRLFFLCLSLMKGRTKLPSLCPCVVGKFTSPSVSSSSFSISLLLPLCCMLAYSLLVVLAGVRDVSVYICAYCIVHARNLLHAVIDEPDVFVYEDFFFVAMVLRVLGRFNRALKGVTYECGLAHVGVYVPVSMFRRAVKLQQTC